jgi:tetratricopeptide (TPR) repeat protein
VAAVERDGRVLRGRPDLLAQDGAAIAQAYVEDLQEDVAVLPKGPDAPARLCAAGEALEFVLERHSEAEALYRRAARTDGTFSQSHDSLRRLHRAQGHWRVVAQLLEQEIALAGDERRAYLTLVLELLSRTRPDAVSGPRWAETSVGHGLPTVYGNLQTLLDASQALADRNVEAALRQRAKLYEPPIKFERPGSKALPGGELALDLNPEDEALELGPDAVVELGEREKARRAAQEEWIWSEANLRRFLLRDGAKALELLTTLFEERGRRDPEMLEALVELLTERRQWDRLKAVYEAVLSGPSAQPEHFEALASLLEVRYRDLNGATRVLKLGVERFPSEATLARRLAEVLRMLDLDDQGQSLIDALGSLAEATRVHEEKAALLHEIGTLFEELSGRTSAAIEMFHEALAVVPHHGPSLRALGRIYSRQNNWYSLAELYEKELAAPDPMPDAWRRRFQLGQLYEDRLGNRASALKHYRILSRERPSFVPAVDSAARILEAEGEWDDLVELLAANAAQTQSRRRQIFLLEQAARWCEERVGNDRLLRELLERLVEVDSESPRALGALRRLYTRTRDWERLVQLHLREASFAQVPEEAATLFWQCGKVTEESLADPKRAEEFYKQSLQVVPDFQPGLEALGRLLDRERRYEALLEISQRELDALDHPRAKVRRMEAMAEILENKLQRRADSIDMIESMREIAPQEVGPVQWLLRLYAQQGRWELVAELLERKASLLGQQPGVSEIWCALGELRERKLGDEASALDAYNEALACEPDHHHAFLGALRAGQACEADLLMLVTRISEKAHTPRARRLSRRFLARQAEQRSGNPAMAVELRQKALSEGSDDRESRDMLEAAYAWKKNLPGLAGLWAAAGRSFEEGLLGLMGVGAGIHGAALLSSFLNRWGGTLTIHLDAPGRRALWEAFLGELGRSALELLHDPEALDDDAWATLPSATRRRVALALMGAPKGGLAQARMALDRANTLDAASLRLRAWLSAGDPKTHLKATQAEIERLLAPELRVRRLLDLADLDPTLRHEALGRAVDQQTFRSPIQEELYERLEEAAEDELLKKALELHLCDDQLPPKRRSLLASNLAATLERLGAPKEEILTLYRMSFEACRDHYHVLLDIARLAEEMGREVEAIQSLDAFLTYSKDLAARVEAGLRLSALSLAQCTPPPEPEGFDPYAGKAPQYDGGPFGRKALDTLTRLREDARGSEFERRCTSKLAHAHAKVGSPYRAVELLQDNLPSPNLAEQWEDALALADLYSERLLDLGRAEQVLWLIFDTDPMREGVLERLMHASRHNGTLAETCKHLNEVARMAAPELISTARRRELLQVVARTLSEDLGHHKQAGAIWEEMADGAKDTQEQRRLRVKQAQCLFRVMGEEGRCHELMLRLQSEDPFDPEPYRGLEILYRELDHGSRLRVVQQARYVLEGGEEPAVGTRRRSQPGRPLDDALLEKFLLPEGLRGGVLHVLRALEPLAVKRWGDTLPTLEALGGHRWKAGEFEQAREFTELAASTFRVQKPKMVLGDSGAWLPQVFMASGPALWFHQGMFEGTGAEVARFVGGYGAGLAWSGLASLVHLDGRDLWHLLEAVLLKTTGEGLTPITDPRSMALVEHVGGVFNRAMCRRIADTATPCLDALRVAHCEAWPEMIAQLALRAGLVMAGQLAGPATALLRARQWKGELHEPETQTFLKRVPELASLLRFALTDDYLELRAGCGLDVKPPKL